MSVCDACHQNVAVIYTNRASEEGTSFKGYCLSCALRKPELHMQSIVRNAGIDETTVDRVTDYLNRMMEPMRDDPPEVLMEKMQEILSNLDPEQLAEGMALMRGEGPGKASDESAVDSGEAEAGAASGSASDHKTDGADGQAKMGELFETFQKKGFAAYGEKSVSEALQMMLNGMMAASGGEGGLMPVARGSEFPAGNSEASGNPAASETTGKRSRSRRRQRKFLDTYGTNLTEEAKLGHLDPIVGRERELERVVQILNRRMKNNPVLLGEPGVGKTAIAEGLAQRIAEAKVPAKLLHMEIYLLDMTAMVAGTQFRGQFESRMKGLVDEAKQLGNIILVIDELHNIMGAGDAEGAMNAANILKPCLARGEIRVLGSTTLSEYRRFVEKDSALERRFQQVLVEEPDREVCMAILRGCRPRYEKHHHVRISDDILAYTYDLADRYVNGRFFPDKAIDILDEAGSAANLKDQALVAYEKKAEELREAEAEQLANDQVLSTEEDRAAMFERQAKHKSRVLKLKQELEEIQQAMQSTELTRDDIASVVQLWTGIPLRRLSETESQKLLHMEADLHQRVIGQDKAVSALARACRRSRSGLGKRHKPSSFIFVGPTGVGKTELVKALAETLFDSEENLIRLDMSEYMEAHTVSKLIGSPPGYVGYDEAGQLTEKIRRHPYSVVLLDEIEKAHPDVFNMLLQILDDGRLTDSHGCTVDFQHTVIVMTSNVGTTRHALSFGFGRDAAQDREEEVKAALKERFRPEFLNRVDEIIVFTRLGREDIRRIAELNLKECEAALAAKGIQLRTSEACRDQLAAEGYSEEYGARPLRKCIQRRIEDPIADMLLEGKLEGKIAIAVDYRDGAYRFDIL